MAPKKGSTRVCAGCLAEIGDENYVACALKDCSQIYHKEICCGGIAPNKDEGASWICPKCRCDLKKGGDNSSTPVRPDCLHERSNVTLREKNKGTSDRSKSTLDKSKLLFEKGKPGTEKPKPPSEMVTLTNEIRLLRQDMSSIKDQLAEMISSLSLCHQRLDDVVANAVQSESRLKALEKRDAEVIFLKSQVSQLQEELQWQSQASLCNEVEIVGITETPNENLYHTVMVTAQKLGVPIEDTDIDWVARVGPRRTAKEPKGEKLSEHEVQTTRPVVVRLVRRGTRDEILRASKSRKHLTSKDIEAGHIPNKLYFNERLTKENRRLFRETRARANEAGYKYCWTRRGNIYVRKQEDYPATHIRSFAALENSFGPSKDERTGDE